MDPFFYPPSDDNLSSTSSREELFPVENFRNFSFSYTDPNLFSGITKAIILKDFAKVKELIEQGKSVRCIDNSGNTPLHVAAVCCTDDNTEILEYLLTLEDVEKDATNFYGQTALLLSAIEELEKASLILVNAGVDVTKATLEEVTPLHYGVRFSEELSQKLILAGADINHEDYNGDTPLHDAITFGDRNIVCMLLYYGADTSIANSGGLTPFMLSLATNKNPIALDLFDYVTDYNLVTKENMSTLYLAITCRFPRIIDMCERGADVSPNENSMYNVFNLEVLPKPNEFRYLWSKFDCDHWPSDWPNILVYIVNHNSIEPAERLEILRIILENEDIEKTMLVTNDLNEEAVLFHLVHALYNMGVSHDVVHKFTACMLMCNMQAYELDLDMVYEHYGYCETFKLLLNMEIKHNILDDRRFNMFPQLIYKVSNRHCFQSRMLKLHRNLTRSVTRLNRVDYEIIFDHLICPRLKRKVIGLCALNFEPEWRTLAEYVNATPDVPFLQDLASIASRDFISEKYKIRTCCQFYTKLRHLPLPRRLKQLISFEVPLYRHDLTPELWEFRDRLKQFREETIEELTNRNAPFYQRTLEFLGLGLAANIG